MAAPVDDIERLKIRIALEDLNTAFTYHLDHNEVDALLDLFVDDVYYTHGERVSRGKVELQEVFRRRGAAAEPRTSRHLYSGLKLEIDDVDHARGTCVCMTFGEYGLPPIQSALPTLVADFDDVYVRCDDGKWRFKERHIRRIFVGAGNTGPVGQTPKR